MTKGIFPGELCCYDIRAIQAACRFLPVPMELCYDIHAAQVAFRLCARKQYMNVRGLVVPLFDLLYII